MSLSPRPTRRFAPPKTGNTSPLGELETAVMEAVWSVAGAQSVGDVHGLLPVQPALAYTTVKTTMERLVEKGILLRSREGRAYTYLPAVTRENLERRIVSRALDRLVEQFPEAVASFMVSPEADVSEERLALLRDGVERRRREENA